MNPRILCTLLGLSLATHALAAPPDHAKNKGNHGAQSEQHGGGHPGGHGDPRLDFDDIRLRLNDSRAYYSPGAALPPGVAKNLARGKPLPPGIAKRVDGRLQGRLPYYEGYEWMQAGTDLLLVTVATGIVYEVLRGVLD